MSQPLAAPDRQPVHLPRSFASRAARALGVVSASVIALPLGSVSAHAAPLPTPKPKRALPSALDVAPPYQKGVRCLSSAQAGPVAFAKLLNETYGTHVYGILRECAAEHGEGRALDWMLNAKDPASLALGNTITRWLAAPDSQGRAGAMARRLGINYIIWNRQQWRAYDPSRGWAPYYGVSPHTDHIHISFTWDGAYERNSWWTGEAVTDPLTGPLGTPPPAPPVLTASGYPLLKQGAQGSDVTLAQKVIGVAADGRFGPLTAGTLATWQSRYGIRATKELDNSTWTTMVNLGAVPNRSATASGLQKYAGTTLRQGSRGDAVKALQKAVGKLTVDGSYGPATVSRVKAYQKSKGLSATGMTDAKVWNALMGKSTTTPATSATTPLSKYASTTLRLGSRGDAVKALQKAIGKLTVDGSYGPATVSRVKAYQKSKGLSATGVTDARVWKALMGTKAPAPTTPPPPTSGGTSASALTKYASVTLRLWSRGDAVKALQKAIGKLSVDGSYGNATVSRVKEYQKSKGLPTTGVTDAKVWKALMGTTSSGGSTTTPTAPASASTSTEFTAVKSATLRGGSSGATVKTLQRGLGGLVVDGAFGSRTTARVKTFQKSVKLPVTGVVDRRTWDALELTVHPLHPYWGTVLKRGSKGAAVTALQKGLRISADGSFGPQTEVSVRAAQKAAKLTQTGVVGTVTWKAIDARMPR